MPWLTEERVKFLKFVLVGGFNTGAMYVLYVVLVWIGLHYNLALAADYVGGIVLGYLLNRIFTFASQGRPRAGFAKYVVTYLLVFGLNLVLLNVAVRGVGMAPEWGQIPALATATIASYCLQRYWVFRGHRH